MADLFVNGIIVGSIITLGAIGVTLIADILNFFNFAHGDMFSFGAYVTLFFTWVLPDLGTFPGLTFGATMVVAALIGMAVTAGIALFFERVLFRPLRAGGSSPLFLALASLGVAFMLRAVIRLLWGSQVQYYSRALQMALKLPFGITVKPDEIFIMVAALLLVAVVYFFLMRTRMGKAMRATSDNRTLARITGIRTRKVVLWTWVIAAALTAAAGVLYGITVQLRPLMGWNILIPIFVAVIVGGVGSLWGAMIGGMLIGIAQEMLTGAIQNLFDLMEVDVLMTAYKPAVAFVLMVLVLLLRPRGIFGEAEE